MIKHDLIEEECTVAHSCDPVKEDRNKSCRRCKNCGWVRPRNFDKECIPDKESVNDSSWNKYLGRIKQ